MPDKSKQPRFWATRVQSDASASLARDFKALGINIAQCQACRGRSFAVSCLGDAFNRFMAPRLVSTLVVVVAAFTALTLLA